MHQTLLQELLPRLQHPSVRALAWVLLSPPLRSQGLGSALRHPLSASCWQQHPGLLADWLCYQACYPQKLQQWLARSPNQRLGHCYERLWQFALRAAPDIDLLTTNLVIYHNQQTLGELDLLTRDAEGLHHIELGIKFYLQGPPSPNETQQWIGLDPRDTLQHKLNTLYHGQLIRPQLTAAQNLLQGRNLYPLRSSFWLGGITFVHWTHHTKAQACWIYPEQWPQLQTKPPRQRWYPWPRHQWLTPPLEKDHLPPPLQNNAQPSPGLLISPAVQGAHYLMLVPPDWPHSPP